MSSGSIARRYARALMGIGVDNNNYDAIGTQVAALAQAMKVSAELSQTLSNPAFPRSDRKKVLTAILDRLGALPVVDGAITIHTVNDLTATAGDASDAYAQVGHVGAGSTGRSLSDCRRGTGGV